MDGLGGGVRLATYGTASTMRFTGAARDAISGQPRPVPGIAQAARGVAVASFTPPPPDRGATTPDRFAPYMRFGEAVGVGEPERVGFGCAGSRMPQ